MLGLSVNIGPGHVTTAKLLFAILKKICFANY